MISIYDYKIWLKIIGTGKIIKTGLRKDILSTIYRQVNVNYLEIISKINWKEEDYE